MKLEPGMLARSKAGHDRDRVYVIIETENEYVYVADGELRPLRHMKRKNSRHLQPILKMRLEGKPDDEGIRRMMRGSAGSSENLSDRRIKNVKS